MTEPGDPRPIAFTLNGVPVRVEVQPYEDAIEVLTRLGVHGARESCGLGMCGCCTIALDGEVVSGCLLLAVFLDGRAVETVEGLAGEDLHPVQQAFVENQAFQCGFCTPGWILMTRQLLRDHPDPSEHEIKHYLAGNACRCASYPDILAAVAVAIRTASTS